MDPGPFFEGAPEPALVLDSEARIVAANAAFASAFGWARSRIVGAAIGELTRPPEGRDLTAALRDPGVPARAQAALLLPDGSAREVEWRLSAGPEGTRFALLRDVTEERRHRRHRDAVERITGVGSWEMEIGSGRVFWSPMTYELHGVDPATFDPTAANSLAFFQGECRARIEAAAGALAARGTPFDIEAAFRDARGRDLWIRATGSAEMRDGRIERVHGTLQDVTGERARRRQLERLGAVARLTTCSVLVSDRQGLVEWVNEAFTTETGYAPEEIVGRAVTMLNSPRADPATMRALAEARAEHRPLRAEVLNRRRDGREILVEVDLQPMRDAEGGPAGWIAVRRDITERREAERRLERLSAVARLTTDAVTVTDGEGRLEWVNDAFVRQTGYALEEVIGRTADFLDSPRNDPAVARALSSALTAGRAVRTEILNLRRDGREIRVEVDLQPLRDAQGTPRAWIAVRRDVTERREAEARLERAEREARESREQLLTAIGALHDGFVLYDRDERMVVCNERYRELYAPSAHAMVPGTTFEEILRAGLRNGQYLDAVGREEEWLAQRLADHRAVDRSLEQSLPGDRWLRVVERATPDGGRVGLRVDITALKRQQRETEEARRRAEKALEAKSLFLATMSHEIRTPMNGILGLVDLLAEGATSPEQARILADVRESGEGLLTILNDILDVSKIEAGRMTLEAIALDPREIARRSEALHAPIARDKGLALRVEVEGGPARLGDPTRLAQVLGNLVSNALKFTERGEVRLSVSNPADGPLGLVVADTGIGMSPEETARAFESFAQADSSVTRRFGGTGLGLSIVQGLVTAMGGRIDVASAPGRGTRIAVELPLPPARAAAQAARAERVDDLEGVRVLAADDNRMNRTVLARLLDRLGAQAAIVASGAEAVEASRGSRFDLILMDISMPDMDGLEALARIRQAERADGRAPVPTLAVTANVLEDQVAGYLARGFAGHLAKPLRLAALASGARAALGENGDGRATVSASGPRRRGPSALPSSAA